MFLWGVASAPSLEIKESQFANEDQQWKWFKSKVEPFISDEFPAKAHENWKLNEDYFEHQRGKETAVTTTIAETLKRASTDLQAAAPLLSLEPESKGKKGDPELKHKSLVGKVMAGIRKLGATINTTEGALPSLRRRVPPTQFSKLKLGLGQARDFKIEASDQLEDLKKLDEPNQFDDVMASLVELQQHVQEHADALAEALKSYQTTIKEPPRDEGFDPDARLLIKT